MKKSKRQILSLMAAAVMAAGLRKLKHKWKLHFFLVISVRKHV